MQRKHAKRGILKLIKESSLNNIPHNNRENPLARTTDQSASKTLVSKLDMEDFKISSISMSYNIENPEHAKIMKEFLKARMGKKLQKEQPNAYIVDFTSNGIETKISSPKSQLLQRKMTKLLQEIHDSPITAKEIMQLQKKLNNSSISPQLLKDLVARVYKTAQINVNGENKGFIKNISNQSSNTNKHLIDLRHGINRKIEAPQINIPYRPIQNPQMLSNSLERLKTLSK